MKTKKMYPALVRWAYATGREKEFIAARLQQQIPRQTKFNWRKTTKKEIFLLEEELEIKDQLDAMQGHISEVLSEKRKMFIGLSRLHLQSIQLIGKDKYLLLISKNKEQFVRFVEDSKAHVPREFLLRWFNISQRRYEKWYFQSQYRCKSSQQQLCAKKFPMQISSKEFLKIKASLQKKEFQNWPLSSIHSKLLRNKSLSISRATFYRYARKIAPNRNYLHKRPKYIPLRATYANEIWHADFSKFRTKDGNWAIIYMLIDNYSRKILAWRCEQKISKHFVAAIIKEAAEKLIHRKLALVTDAGTENVNHLIDHIIEELNAEPNSHIVQKIALKDIRQSNSMIERVFRVMKSGYLYKRVPEDYLALIKALELLVFDYNYVRPHHANQHLTPHEKHIGVKIPDLAKQMQMAMASRKKANLNCPCTVCDCQTKYAGSPPIGPNPGTKR